MERFKDFNFSDREKRKTKNESQKKKESRRAMADETPRRRDAWQTIAKVIALYSTSWKKLRISHTGIYGTEAVTRKS